MPPGTKHGHFGLFALIAFEGSLVHQAIGEGQKTSLPADQWHL
jgi:hypothetical protein